MEVRLGGFGVERFGGYAANTSSVGAMVLMIEG
jgi:hypothetical protein